MEQQQQEDSREIQRESVEPQQDSSEIQRESVEPQQDSHEIQRESVEPQQDSSCDVQPENICGICQENFFDLKLLFPDVCPNGHIFHEICILRWVLEQFQEQRIAHCPTCRSSLPDYVSLLNTTSILNYMKLRDYVDKNRDGLSENLRTSLMAKLKEMGRSTNDLFPFLLDLQEKWPEPDANLMAVRLSHVFEHDPNKMKELKQFVAAKHKCTPECLEKMCFFLGNYGRIVYDDDSDDPE